MNGFFKSKSNVILLAIVLILAIGLSATAYVTVQKHHDLNRAKAATAAANDSLQQTKKELDSVQAQLTEQQQANNNLQAQLQESESKKQELEQQVAGLNEQLTQLRAKKSSPSTVPPDPNRVCYLTFDDGPSDNTLQILDILARYNVKATFFVINNPSKMEYLKRIAAEGHTIGLHSACHNYAAIYACEDNYFSDLQQISDIVENLTGIKSRVIRFPGGSSNGVSSKYNTGIMTRLTAEVQKRGYAYFDWNVSSEDAAGVAYSPAQLCNNVLKGAKGKSSVCVLMHDAAAKKNTVAALPSMIEGLQAQGFTFAGLTPESYGFHHSKLNN